MKKLLTLLFILVAARVSAQWIPSVSIGYGNFSMKGVRKLHDEYRSKFAVPVAWTEDYPAYYTYTFRVLRQKERVAFGLFAGSTSTGGRIYYADYSGYAGVDNTMLMRFAGGSFALVYDIKKFVVSPGVGISNYWNSMELYSYEKLTDQKASSTRTEWESTSFVIGPQVEVRRRFGRCVLMLNAGYEVSVYRERLHSADQKSLYVVTKDKEFVRVDVDGFRVSGGLGFALGERD